MKATGIVRRIDDLGRVVIPKEIRRTMSIRQGAQLEIFTQDDGSVVFKKYSPLEGFSSLAAGFADALSRITGESVAVCDREKVIALAGRREKELVGARISPELAKGIEARCSLTYDSKTTLCEKAAGVFCTLAVPVTASSQVMGCVALVCGEKNLKAPQEANEKTVAAAAALLGLQFED